MSAAGTEKEEVKLYGVKTAQVSQIGKGYAGQIKAIEKMPQDLKSQAK